MLRNNLNNFYGAKDMLLDKLLDIKSMETTKNLQKTLEEALKTCDDLKTDVEVLQNIKDNFDEIKSQNNEVKDMFVNYNQENVDVK